MRYKYSVEHIVWIYTGKTSGRASNLIWMMLPGKKKIYCSPSSQYKKKRSPFFKKSLFKKVFFKKSFFISKKAWDKLCENTAKKEEYDLLPTGTSLISSSQIHGVHGNYIMFSKPLHYLDMTGTKILKNPLYAVMRGQLFYLEIKNFHTKQCARMVT